MSRCLSALDICWFADGSICFALVMSSSVLRSPEAPARTSGRRPLGGGAAAAPRRRAPGGRAGAFDSASVWRGGLFGEPLLGNLCSLCMYNPYLIYAWLCVVLICERAPAEGVPENLHDSHPSDSQLSRNKLAEEGSKREGSKYRNRRSHCPQKVSFTGCKPRGARPIWGD